MSKKYVIRWKSKVNGRAGKGTKLFELEEARELAAELNAGYPDILHEVVAADEPRHPVSSQNEPGAPVEAVEQAETEDESASAPAQLHAFSALA